MQFEQLRDRQQDTILTLRKGWKAHQCHLINAPCGFGKTALSAYFCGALAKSGKTVVFAAPYTALVNQTYERFQQYGMEAPSVIWQKDPRFNPNSKIHIASADTLIARDEMLPPNTDVLIWDECHIRRADLLQYIKENPKLKVIGLSATPYPDWLGENYTNFIKPATTREQIAEGWLVPFEIHHPNLGESIDRMKGVPVRAGDYAQGKAAAAMMETKIVGDILENWINKGVDISGRHLQTIGFAVNKAAANAYCIEFQRAGIAAEVITDKTPVDERNKIYKRFEQGTVTVIWNVGVLGAGFDGHVECIIWAKPTKSESVWVQGALRGSRAHKASGKKVCVLFDHTPTYFELGDPCDIEYYELNDGSDGLDKARQVRREKEKLEHRAKICARCGRNKPEGEYQCKGCGHKPLAGEFPETDESIGLTSASGKEKTFSSEQKQAYWSSLLGLQQQNKNKGLNKKDAYYGKMYQEKFGEWPSNNSELKQVVKPPTQEILGKVKQKQIAWAKSPNNPRNQKKA